ncbi:hypothetical protein FQN49_004289 [Arthroderma sp. PD_2]|nr:hypothetical protein FQN49_004289 [Arthroderma sp. PD_2]
MDPSQSAYGHRHSVYGRPREPRNSSLPPRHCPPSSLSTSHTQQSHFDPIASSRREPSNTFSRHPPPPVAPPSLGYSYSRDIISHTQQNAGHRHNNGAPRQRPDAATREPRFKHRAEETKDHTSMNMRREEFFTLFLVKVGVVFWRVLTAWSKGDKPFPMLGCYSCEQRKKKAMSLSALRSVPSPSAPPPTFRLPLLPLSDSWHGWSVPNALAA